MRFGRRDFLKFLLAAPIAATVDVEKLLWVPKPIITVPAITLDQINAITVKQIMPGIVDSFFKSGPLLAYLKGRQLGHDDGRWTV